jgi:hypothetical protein
VKGTVKLTRNRKKLVGLAILLTSSAFYIVVLGTFDRIPWPFLATYLVCAAASAILSTLGSLEEKKEREASNSVLASPEPR